MWKVGLRRRKVVLRPSEAWRVGLMSEKRQ